ncbi:invasion associated locus B family protein [Pseudorhizobium flavum]|uniref:invasion associated locus B family protein n=1 Tax=Pseudorhizobium flavum TaxID=1335061 RepID=UPI002491FB91|nr:invasion associated locus B family protein [Pseudorhizobium flavum]
MSLRHHLKNVPAQIAIAFSLTLLLAGPTNAQQIPLDDAAKPDSLSSPAETDAEDAAKKGGRGQPTETAEAGKKLKPWTVRCATAVADQPVTCQMYQTLADSKTGTRMIAVSIRKQPQGMSMVLAMPHGLYIPGGVAYQIDSGPKKSIPIAASDKQGVYATLPVDDGLLAAMKRGNTFRVMLSAPNQRQFAIPMTLSGFTAAAEELVAAKQ